MKIVIIEDEPFAQQELLRLIEKTARNFELLAMIDSVEESLEWFNTHPHPDLVFLDIQLADGLSFDIFREIELKSAVIFTTAYDEFAIRAFELNSIDYLLKPVKPEALEAALNKFDKMKQDITPGKTGLDEQQLKQVLEQMASKIYKSRFLVKLGDQIRSIGLDDTAYFKAEDNVVFLVGKDAHKFIIENTLEQLEGMLDPEKFFRLSRAYIVGYSSIGKVSKYFNSRLLVELKPAAEEKVLVSRGRVKAFMEWLDR